MAIEPSQISLRLLPGDKAPYLRLSLPLNKKKNPTIIFDRISVVVLWNAGCAGCLPVIESISSFSYEHGIPCYGISVMVRDIEATLLAAAASKTEALLAVEESDGGTLGLSRGWVTKHWLEASGQEAVPAGFIIDEKGDIAWMGDPGEIKDVLPKIISRSWNVAAARQHWKALASDEEIQLLRLDREVSDAIVVGNSAKAIQVVENAQGANPSIYSNKKFSLIKFDALVSDPHSREAALAQYVECSNVFRDDWKTQLRLATWITRITPLESHTVEIVTKHLSELETRLGNEAEGKPDTTGRLMLQLTFANIFIQAGSKESAKQRVQDATVICQDGDLPPNLKTWAESEIGKLKSQIAA